MSSRSVRENKEIIERVEQVLQGAYKENSEFNTQFNGEAPLTIPSLRSESPPYKLEASDALFWTDRSAYYDELGYWMEGYTQEQHAAALNELRETDQIPVFHDLVDAIKRNRIAPFIGAGMSQPTGFPLWGAALTELIARVGEIDVEAVQAQIKKFNYLKAAQLLWDQDDIQVKNFIRTKFAEQKIQSGGITGPILLLKEISKGCLITTNFDSVIEHVIGKGELEGYMHGMQQGNKFVPKLIKGDRCILKLHGDAEDHDTYVFTEEQYRKAYGDGDSFDFSKPLPRALRQIYISHSLLFLGCSLEQDRTLALFQHVYDQKQFEIPDHYAILPDPGSKRGRSKKERLLLNIKIRPIWYPSGKHEFVECYLKLAIAVVKGQLSLN